MGEGQREARGLAGLDEVCEGGDKGGSQGALEVWPLPHELVVVLSVHPIIVHVRVGPPAAWCGHTLRPSSVLPVVPLVLNLPAHFLERKSSNRLLALCGGARTGGVRHALAKHAAQLDVDRCACGGAGAQRAQRGGWQLDDLV